MADFHEQPIVNSPYELPGEHWELDENRQPTNRRILKRRPAAFVIPVPKPRKQKRQQAQMVFDRAAAEVSSDSQRYDLDAHINGLRRQLDAWRQLPAQQWRVTPQTARLLQHWRDHPFNGIRPFFCQVEAAETVIWLTEVAPNLGREARNILKHIQDANDGANPGLSRLALKLATGAGKTTVMAMLIAWQTVNAVRHPGSNRFTRGFLVVTPGITIRERLRVLQPNDPDSYYQTRELVPQDMLPDLRRATIVITNYHAFIRRERMQLSKGSRTLLQGHGPDLRTQETQGQMRRRVMPKNQGLGFTVPYRFGDEARTYLPDFIVLADDGHGQDDLLHLVVEVKGRRLEDAKAKKETMETQWLPGVNRLREYGRWKFIELRDVYSMREDLDAALRGERIDVG